MFPGGTPNYRALVREGPRPLRLGVAMGSRVLQKHPILAKIGPCSIGFAFGDLLTQLGAHSRRQDGQPFQWDVTKAAAMAAVGLAVAAPTGLQFCRMLDVLIPSTGIIASSVKFTLDQVVGCVIWQVAYCSLVPEYRVGLMAFLERLSDSASVVATTTVQRVRMEMATA